MRSRKRLPMTQDGYFYCGLGKPDPVLAAYIRPLGGEVYTHNWGVVYRLPEEEHEALDGEYKDGLNNRWTVPLTLAFRDKGTNHSYEFWNNAALGNYRTFEPIPKRSRRRAKK